MNEEVLKAAYIYVRHGHIHPVRSIVGTALGCLACALLGYVTWGSTAWLMQNTLSK
jgi:hypothetical protein